MGRRGISACCARRPCPVCGRVVAVGRTSERVWAHKVETQRCPGSGQKVDLYGGWGR